MLLPYKKTSCRRQAEIISAPDYGHLRNTQKLFEEFRLGCFVPAYDFFEYFAAQVPPVLDTDFIGVEPPSEPIVFLLFTQYVGG